METLATCFLFLKYYTLERQEVFYSLANAYSGTQFNEPL